MKRTIYRGLMDFGLGMNAGLFMAEKMYVSVAFWAVVFVFLQVADLKLFGKRIKK